MSCNDEFLSLVASYPSSAEIREVNLFLDSPSEIRSFFSSIKFDFDRMLSDILNSEIDGRGQFWRTSSYSNTCTFQITHSLHDLYFTGEFSFEFGYDEEETDLPTSVNPISFDVSFYCR